MRIEEISIGSFGPFSDRTLPLAPGMTIVFGPNEAGKSTWHAALYAALCGMRRSRGTPRTEDREFAQRHRPWNGDAWTVGAIVRLEDGRRVEMRQDLDGRIDCRAVDLSLGHDLSADVINEGTPDASRWLGLDRRTFLATACVRQAAVLNVLTSATELQEDLQRAAATARADATAARALELLDEFRRENIGLDRTGSTKPLRRAIDRHRDADSALREAKAAHEEYLRLVGAADRLEHVAREEAASVRAFEAALRAKETAECEAKLSRARELAASHSGPPPDLSRDDDLARAVAAALEAWTGMPFVPELSGPSSEELRRDLAALPKEPLGDLEPAPDVLAARAKVAGAGEALERYDSARPPDPEHLQVSGNEQQLRDLARDLEVPQPKAVPVAARKRTAALLGAIGFMVVGGLAAVFGYVWPGLIAIAFGVGAGTWVLLRSERLTRQAAADELRALRRQEAVAVAAQLNLVPDPAKFREQADRLAEAGRRGAALQRWQAGRELLRRGLEEAQKSLAEALARRGAASFDEYAKRCDERSALARDAARRPSLAEQMRNREVLERAVQNATGVRKQAERGLREVAARCGVVGEDDAHIADGLREWQRRHTERLAENAVALGERAELKAILGGDTLEAFETTIRRRREAANQLAAEISPERLAAVDLGDDPAERLRQLRPEEVEAARRANQARGQVDDRARTLPSVAEAEEEVAAAAEELERVRALEETIKRTEEFLERAQERVHRDIAPVLAGTLKRWLPRVTGGRYDDAIVDPGTLNVKVRGGGSPPRETQLLSQGTREQIYLLLRVAMVQHLTRRGEVCPLLLDEVTVQSDAARTAAMLELLHEMSRERQVVLFTQEDHVRAWAETHLQEPQNRLVVLDPGDVAV